MSEKDKEFTPTVIVQNQPKDESKFIPYTTSSTTEKEPGVFKAIGSFVKKNVEGYLKKLETPEGFVDEALGGSNFGGVGGFAGTFIGKNAKFFDEAMERLASEMKDRGASVEDIWRATGNRRWNSGSRQEISDKDMALKFSNFNDANLSHYASGNGKTVKIDYDTANDFYNKGNGDKIISTAWLGSLLEHPELFKNYPGLEKTRVVISPKYKSNSAAYDPKSDTIYISTEDFYNKNTSPLLHEIQHKVQTIEGWQNGGNPDQFSKLDELIPKKGSGSPRRYTKYEHYQALPGELESRTTQARQFWTDRMRRDLPPYSPDIPAKDMLIHSKKYGVKK